MQIEAAIDAAPIDGHRGQQYVMDFLGDRPDASPGRIRTNDLQAARVLDTLPPELRSGASGHIDGNRRNFDKQGPHGIATKQRPSKAHKVSYVEDRLAEIRASMGSDVRTKPPKRSKAKAISDRLKNRRAIAASHSESTLEREAAARIDRFVELAQQLSVEDSELIEK